MPGRTVVSNDEIAEAAARLAAAGEVITGWTLRRTLGGRGRADRLEAVWRELQADAVPPPPPEPEAPPLPPAISELLTSAEERALADLRAQFAAAWRLASDLASRRVAEEVRVARDQVTALQAELAEAMRAVEEADAQADAVQDDFAAAKQAAKSAEVAVADLRAEMARGAAAADARHEAMSVEAERLRGELAAARQTIDDTRGAFAAAEARAAGATEATGEARAERDVARQEAAQARAEHRQLEGMSARNSARAEAAEQRAAEAEQRSETAEEARRVVAEQLTQALVRAEVAEASALIWRDHANASKAAVPPEVEAPDFAAAPASDGVGAAVMAPAAAQAAPRGRRQAAHGGPAASQRGAPSAESAAPAQAP